MGVALNFKTARPQVAVSGFAADADPRSTPPGGTSVFTPLDRVSKQSADDHTKGLAVFVQFVDDSNALVSGPTADFTLWFFDEGSASWLQGPVVTGAACNQLRTTSLIGKLFVQLNAIHSPGAATKINVYASELAILPV